MSTSMMARAQGPKLLRPDETCRGCGKLLWHNFSKGFCRKCAQEIEAIGWGKATPAPGLVLAAERSNGWLAAVKSFRERILKAKTFVDLWDWALGAAVLMGAAYVCLEFVAGIFPGWFWAGVR